MHRNIRNFCCIRIGLLINISHLVLFIIGNQRAPDPKHFQSLSQRALFRAVCGILQHPLSRSWDLLVWRYQQQLQAEYTLVNIRGSVLAYVALSGTGWLRSTGTGAMLGHHKRRRSVQIDALRH